MQVYFASIQYMIDAVIDIWTRIDRIEVGNMKDKDFW